MIGSFLLAPALGSVAWISGVVTQPPTPPSVDPPTVDAPPPPPPAESELPDLEATPPGPAGPASAAATDSPPSPTPSPPAENAPSVPAPAPPAPDAPLQRANRAPPLEPLPIASDEDRAHEREPIPRTESTPAPESLPVANTPDRNAVSDEAIARESALRREDLRRSSRDYESPQRFAIEFKMGPYLPDVDRDYRGAGFGPYATIFGETTVGEGDDKHDTGLVQRAPKRHAMPVIGVEWQFLDVGGPLSIGSTVGLFRDSAPALLGDLPGEQDATTPDAGESENASDNRSTADVVRFNLVPITLLAGYRFELLADRFRVPLVPYVRGGLAYGVWWSLDGAGTIETDDRDQRAKGGSLGWQTNLGAMLRLDFIERESARELDRTSGINHTYLFGEYQISRIGGLGSRAALDVGHDTWMAGLAMEF